MTMVNAYAPGATPGLSGADAALIARRDRALGPAYRLFYEKPLHVVSGEGVWLIAADGRRYLDAYNNVASLGHCHPAVVEAIRRQAGVLNTHTRYLHEGVVRYAESLLSTMPGALAHLMLTCTGSEANDLALRVARAATGGDGVIVTTNAYHGVTAAVAEASPSLGPDNRIGAHVWTVGAPSGGGEVGKRFARGVSQALEQMAARHIRPAALLVDTLFSSDGVFADPAGFLKEAVTRVRSAGGLFIADEVQAGFARVGRAFWGYARHDLQPDLVTLGKPMGNGHPVAGVAMLAGPAAAFGARVRYFNTFGGNPVSAAAAQAVLDVIRTDGLAENAEIEGAFVRRSILDLKGRHPLIREVRGAGLFVGVEVVGGAATAAKVVNFMREDGVLISATGPDGDILKIRPPLVIQREHAIMLVTSLDAALTRAALDP